MGYFLSTEIPPESTAYEKTYYCCKVGIVSSIDGLSIGLYYRTLPYITTAFVLARSCHWTTLVNSREAHYYDITVRNGRVIGCEKVYPEIHCCVRKITPTANYSFNRLQTSDECARHILVSSSVRMITGQYYSFVFEYDEDDNKVAKRILDDNGNEVYSDSTLLN